MPTLNKDYFTLYVFKATVLLRITAILNLYIN